MSFNLIDLVKDQLSDQVMNQVTSMLGGDANQASSAIGGAIPGLLEGLMNAGSDSTKADDMVNAITKQDDSILDNLGDLLGNSDSQSSMLSTGAEVLSSLLGNNALGTLASTIAGFSGLGKGSSKSLLGFLAPVIFSLIKRKLLGSGGLNMASLMDMFSGQKENIAAAMPAGFIQQLSGSDTITRSDSISSSAPDMRENLNDVAAPAGSTGGSWLARLLPLALLCGLIWFAYDKFTKSEIEIPDSTAIPQSTTDTIINDVAVPEVAVPAVSVPEVNVKEELSVILGSVTNSLGSISDVESAKQAVPQLNAASEKIGGLANIVGKLPAIAKEPVKQVITGGLPQLQALIDKAIAIPGVGPVLQPVTDGLLQKIALLEQ
ncbi:MAG: DUF937 domain-containing protein [Methylococcales bacterium]